jgi:hypothetical protein
MQTRSRRVATAIIVLAVSTAAAAFSSPAVTSASLQLPAFNSIDVRNNGHVVLRPAPAQRVTLLKGSLDYTRVEVVDRVLVIDKCPLDCPRGYELEVEIAVPAISSISLANGGRVQTLGSFARQADLAARVSHGGTIDVRSMTVDRVNAVVEQGGRILTAPRGWLFATVTQGGVVTYWGNPQVKSSVQYGGIVSRGSADEINLPLFDVGPTPPTPPHPVYAPVLEGKKHQHRKH